MDAHEPFEREFRVVWPDGSVHWALGRGEFLFDETDSAIRMRGVVQDTTARKAAEALLRENEHRFEEAQRDAGIGSWRYLADGTVIWSSQMYELLPVPRDVPLTHDQVVRVIHPDDRPGGVTGFVRALHSGASDYAARLPRDRGPAARCASCTCAPPFFATTPAPRSRRAARRRT